MNNSNKESSKNLKSMIQVITGKKAMLNSTREAIVMYCFLAPVLIGIVAFVVYPVIYSLILSFQRYNIIGYNEFVGMRNWIRIFTDDRLFYISVRVTLLFTLFSVSLNLFFGFILAIMLNRPRVTVGLFRTLFYIPGMIAGGAPSMLVWLWIFSREGLLNAMLGQVGIQGPTWLQQFPLGSIVAMSAWGVGGIMIIFISGLKAVPDELYEAAEIDGASYFKKMFKITIPMLTPVILYNLILGVIGALQTFTQAYVLTGGGPRFATTFYALNIYNQAFVNMNFGYASALAWLLFVVIMLLTFLIFKSSVKWVFYGDGSNS